MMTYFNKHTIRFICWMIFLSPVFINSHTIATENGFSRYTSTPCMYERDTNLQSHFMLFVLCKEQHHKK